MNKKTSILPFKYRRTMLRTMRGVFRIVIEGGKLEIKDMNPDEGIGCSMKENDASIILIASAYPFEDIDDPEKELVLYGVATHEALHLLRTDFDYAARQLAKQPPAERRIRHTFANIVEDAAIEYLRSDRLSDFLNKALTAAIGYFHKTAEPLGNHKSAFTELMSALIMFGDVGTIKGSFRYKEAEEAFIKVVPLYEEAIVEPSFAKRYKISQDMFEMCRQIWEDHVNQQISAESLINELMKSLGKNLFNGDRSKSKPAEDGKSGSSSAGSKSADMRRKKTIHLINKNQAQEMEKNASGNQTGNPEDATDIYVVMDQDNKEESQKDPSNSNSVPVPGSAPSSKEGSADPSKDFDVVDERPEASKEETSKETGSNSSEGESNGNPSEGSDGNSSEGESNGNSSEGTDGNPSEGSGESSSKGFEGNSSENSNGNSSDSSGGNSSETSGNDASKGNSSETSGSDSSKGNSSEASSNNSSESMNEGSLEGNATASVSEGPNGNSSSSSSGKDGESLSKEDVLAGLNMDGKDVGKKKDSSSQGKGESLEEKESSGSVVNGIPDDSSKEKKDLGEELRELSRSLSEEIKASGELEISKELSEEMKEGMENDLAVEAAQEHLEAKKSKAEAIDVTVSSPYYSGVNYVNVEVTSPNESAYRAICTDEIKRLTLNLRSAFKKVFRFKSGHKEYRTNGRIDIERFSGKKLSARMFYRNSKPDDKADMAIVIFIDQSGSMRNVVNRVKQTMVVLLDALRGFDVKVKVVGFTTSRDVVYYHYGNRRWENDGNLVKSVMNLNATGGTFLGHALRYTGTMLKNRPETNKLYICITDGDPAYSVYKNYSEGMNDCRAAVNEVRKFADVIGIGLYRSQDEEEAFKYVFRDACVSMSSLDGLVRELPKRIKKILNT